MSAILGVIKPDFKQDAWGYCRPEGYSLGGFPIRMTRKEWEDDINASLSDMPKVFYLPHFTMYQWLEWTGNRECGGYDYAEVFEIYLNLKLCKHKHCHKHMSFGPHRNPTLAREKTLKFLVEHGFIELLQEKGIQS
jgi:hypothetical protein